VARTARTYSASDKKVRINK